MSHCVERLELLCHFVVQSRGINIDSLTIEIKRSCSDCDLNCIYIIGKFQKKEHLSLLHLSHDRRWGDRFPALWLYGSSLVVAMEIDGKWNTYRDIPGKLVEGKWMDIEIRQYRKDGTVS